MADVDRGESPICLDASAVVDSEDGALPFPAPTVGETVRAALSEALDASEVGRATSLPRVVGGRDADAAAGVGGDADTPGTDARCALSEAAADAVGAGSEAVEDAVLPWLLSGTPGGGAIRSGRLAAWRRKDSAESPTAAMRRMGGSPPSGRSDGSAGASQPVDRRESRPRMVASRWRASGVIGGGNESVEGIRAIEDRPISAARPWKPGAGFEAGPASPMAADTLGAEVVGAAGEEALAAADSARAAGSSCSDADREIAGGGTLLDGTSTPSRISMTE